MLRLVLGCVVLLGCSSAPTTARPPNTTARDRSLEAQQEQQRRTELSAAHRVLEDEQSTAFAATCDQPAGTQPRCEPSCYRAEPADPRAGKKLGRAELVHLVCRSAGEETGPIVFADEIDGGTVRPLRGRIPKPAKKGTWQAEIESAVLSALKPEVGRGDAIRVTGSWKAVTHPITKEPLRCVTVSHHVTAMQKALDACGARGGIACEASGNAAAHAINVVHYRLAEARQLQAAGNEPACQRATLEAIAVARGLPRWRQYVAINMNQWKEFPRYRTRFDGIVDEETLFATVAAHGKAAEQVYAQCGGSDAPRTTAAQEQSFHTCW